MSNRKFTEKLWNESRNSIYKHHPEITSFIFISNIKFTKLHFTTLNYALYYTLHHKLSDCTLCTLNYHTYHALHPSVIFAVIFNRTLLHVTSTCFLLRWNKVKKLKQPFQTQLKQNPIFFFICLVSHRYICTLPLSKITQNLRVSLVSSLAIDKV